MVPVAEMKHPHEVALKTKRHLAGSRKDQLFLYGVVISVLCSFSISLAIAMQHVLNDRLFHLM